MITEQNILEKIKSLPLDCPSQALFLYKTYCDYLKTKYGPVDRDYDENPTTRGKEWLDIHHILEYKKDDIAKKTQRAQRNKDEQRLIELKPYNRINQLVYANRIEHFLLHYLLASYFGKDIFCGGINFLWDSSVALDVYGSTSNHMNIIKKNKEQYYSLLSSQEITLLYKKMIDWKDWNINDCCKYWENYQYTLKCFSEQDVSYIENKDKFFELFKILGYNLSEEIKNNILTLPYRAKIIHIGQDNTLAKRINNHIYDMDEKTILRFENLLNRKSFTIPYDVEIISEGAFINAPCLEQITIPETVQKIDSNTFLKREEKEKTVNCGKLKKIIYEGTKENWEARFSNVHLGAIRLSCTAGKIARKKKQRRSTTPTYDHLLGKWHNDEHGIVFTLEQSPEDNSLWIHFANSKFKIIPRDRWLLSFYDTTNTLSYIFISKNEQDQTLLVLSNSLDLEKAEFKFFLPSDNT